MIAALFLNEAEVCFKRVRLRLDTFAGHLDLSIREYQKVIRQESCLHKESYPSFLLK